MPAPVADRLVQPGPQHLRVRLGEMAAHHVEHRLRAVRDICLTNVHRLTTTIDAAKRCTAEMEMRPEPDVDRMLSATSLVENQYVIVSLREMANGHKL